MSLMASFCAVFFSTQDVLGEIWNLIESVSEDFPSYSCRRAARFALILYFRMVANKAASYTLSKAFL